MRVGHFSLCVHVLLHPTSVTALHMCYYTSQVLLHPMCVTLLPSTCGTVPHSVSFIASYVLYVDKYTHYCTPRVLHSCPGPNPFLKLAPDQDGARREQVKQQLSSNSQDRARRCEGVLCAQTCHVGVHVRMYVHM